MLLTEQFQKIKDFDSWMIKIKNVHRHKKSEMDKAYKRLLDNN